jgi:hypothetical protein
MNMRASFRMNRGGSWCSGTRYVRVTYCEGTYPSYSAFLFSFRLSRVYTGDCSDSLLIGPRA